MLPILSLFLVLPAPAVQAPAAPPAGKAVLELMEGRAVLVTGAGADRTAPIELRLGEESTVGDRGLLELKPLARASVRWKGRLSAQIEGPAFFEWEPSREENVAPGSLSLRIQRLENLEMEVREGRHTLHLPGDWRAKVESTAFFMGQRAGGGFELKVHGGKSVAMEWRGDPRRARPPVWALPGRAVQFHLPAISPPDDRLSEHAWPEPEWPWAAPTAPPGSAGERQRLVALLDRHAAGAQAWPPPPPEGAESGELGIVLPEVDRVSATEPPEATDVDPSSLPPWLRTASRTARKGPGAVRARSSNPVQTRQPANPAQPSPGPAPNLTPSASARGWLLGGQDPPVALENYRVDDWRGVAIDRLRWAGSLIVTETPGVEIRERSRGRVKVTVSGQVKQPVWVFGPAGDTLLEPGSVVTFLADGKIQTRIGSATQQPPTASRPLEAAP